jgi:hypothetical protein
MTRRKKRKRKKIRRRKQSLRVRRKQQPSPKTGSRILTDWARKLREEGRLQDKKLVINPPSHDKMSDALFKIIGDYKEIADTEEEMRKLVLLAIIAWNATVISEEGQQDLLAKMLEPLPDGLDEVIAELMKRKLMFFPDNYRFILDYNVTDLGDSFHLSVVSTLSLPKDAD